MRSTEEVEEFKNQVFSKGIREKKKRFLIEAFEGCIPMEFWYIKKKSIKQNVDIFKEVILKYCQKLNKARRRGFGLCLIGDNGVGKTYFLSYVLTRAIKEGKTVYYTTMPQLEYDIMLGFDDKDAKKYLSLMLTSDFLVIDELGKEQRAKREQKLKGKKRAASFIDQQLERILKNRFDNAMPVLLGSNLDFGDLSKTYGTSVVSVLKGKYLVAELVGDDYREVLAAEMRTEMGYDDDDDDE